MIRRDRSTSVTAVPTTNFDPFVAVIEAPLNRFIPPARMKKLHDVASATAFESTKLPANIVMFDQEHSIEDSVVMPT